jgi:hypothetical protein
MEFVTGNPFTAVREYCLICASSAVLGPRPGCGHRMCFRCAYFHPKCCFCSVEAYKRKWAGHLPPGPLVVTDEQRRQFCGLSPLTDDKGKKEKDKDRGKGKDEEEK